MTWEQHQLSHPPSLPSGSEHFPYLALPILVRLLLTSRAVGSIASMGFFVGGSSSRPSGGLGLLLVRAEFFS